MLTIHPVFPAKEDELYKGLYIVIIHLSRIPPHLFLAYNGELFSITISGPKPNEPLVVLIRASSQKAFPILFCKIKENNTSSEIILKSLELAVEKHQQVKVGGASCLAPLKSFFEEVYSLNIKNVNFIFDLIPLLESEKLIEAYHSIGFKDTSITINGYTQAEIDQEILRASSSL